MFSLPFEIISHVLSNNDNINLSMTCKYLNTILEQMFEQSQLFNYNDSYYLKKYYDKLNILAIEEYIPNITNHNCLNLIYFRLLEYHVVYKEFSTEFKPIYRTDILYKLLLQNSITNNISKPKYIYQLCYSMPINPHYRSTKNKKNILKNAFKNNSNEIIIMLLLHIEMRDIWIQSVFTRYKSAIDADELIAEIKLLNTKHVMSLSEIYYQIYYLTPDDFHIKNDILDYVGTFLGKNIVESYTNIKFLL
jgi:hypothetical protein